MKRMVVCTLLIMSSVSHGFVDAGLAVNVEDHQFHDGINIIPEQDELIDFSQVNKNFPRNIRIRAYDPVNRVSYQEVLLGPARRAGLFRAYDFWRYVTVYNIEKESEQISYLPYFTEDCHDRSFSMAQWGESRTVKVTIKSEIGFSELGLSASVGMSLEQGVTISSQRRIGATEGIKANHYPHKVSDIYKGVTYIQTYNEETREFGYIKPSRFQNWTNSYPYPFELDNQNVGFKVVREVIEECEGYDGSSSSGSDIPPYLL